MRALLFDQPAPDQSASRVGEVPIPRPGNGELAIDVEYAGINFKDVMARRGDAGYASDWPFVPGVEVAGTVRELGAGVTGFEIGQCVAAYTGDGGLAQVAIAQAELVATLPDGVTAERASGAPAVLATAVLLANEPGRIRPGDTVLVHSAAGAIGQSVARLARRAGAGLLLGSVGHSGRLDAAKRACYDATFVRGPGLAAEILDHTDGRGVHVILDPQGTQLLRTDLEIAAPGARIVLFGNASGAPLADVPTGLLYGGNVTVTGFSLQAMAARAPARIAEALATALAGLAAGSLDIELSVTDGLESAIPAQQALSDGTGRGKQIIHL